MYKKITLIAVLFTSIIFANANSLSIRVTDSIISLDTKISLKYYKEGYLTTTDSFFITKENKDKLNFNVNDYFGYAEISLSNSKEPIGFIINPKEKNIDISFSLEEFSKNKIVIQNSRDNVLYASLLDYRAKFDKTINEIKYKRATQSRFDSVFLNKMLLYENQLQNNYNQMNLLCDSILKYDTTLYTAIVADFLKTPTGSYFPEYRKYFDNYDALLHWHFFDYIDFSSPDILHHPALALKINEYFERYTENNNISQTEGIDMIMQKAAANPTVRNFMFNHLLEYFLNINLDFNVKYIYDKYADGCGLQLSSQKLKEIGGIIYTNISSKIPDIVANDSKGEIRSLLNESSKNKYTLVYIWTSWCNACQTKTPKIVEISNSFLKKGLGVFSISLDDKKDNWLSSILKYKLDSWTNVSELIPIQNSNVILKLNIRTTPKLFIIDKNGIIISKDLFGDDLQKKLTELLK